MQIDELALSNNHSLTHSFKGQFTWSKFFIKNVVTVVFDKDLWACKANYQWNDDEVRFVLEWILIALVNWHISPWVDMSPHFDILFWFRANQSLLFILIACVYELFSLKVSHICGVLVSVLASSVVYRVFPCLMFILLFHNMYITLEVHKGFLWCIELPTPKKNKKLK
jgi:hypothetical protein